MFRDGKSAKWSLSADAPEIKASDDALFTHIEWGSSGLELVAADQFGRLSLFNTSCALNRLERRPVNLDRTADDLNQIVGIHWLPMNLAAQARVSSLDLLIFISINFWCLDCSDISCCQGWQPLGRQHEIA